MRYPTIQKAFSIFLILVMILSLYTVHPPSVHAEEYVNIAADGIIVKYKQNKSLSLASQEKNETGRNTPGFSKIKPEKGKSIGDKIRELKADPSVEYAEPNYILSSQAVDDILVPQQWAFPALDTEDAWSDLQSYLDNYHVDTRQVKVAVIDTGIDGTHEDLLGKVTAGKNILTGNDIPANTLSDDSVNSHGTMVAGIIAANTNNEAGIAGMSGDFPISLIPVKVLDQNGCGTMLDIINGITWAADQGANVINMSFGARLPDYPLAFAEAVQYAENKGATLIAAAGNEGVSLKGFYPADLEGVLSAAAYEKHISEYVIAGFSNTDYLWNAYTEKCFLLPGVDILTTIRSNGYGSFTGTSASAAFLSSIAALLAACSDTSQAKDRILESIQNGAYYGSLNVGIFDAPTAYNITDEFRDYEADVTPWVVFRYEGSNTVRDTVNIPVFVNQPGLVEGVSFYICEGSGDLSSNKTLLDTIPNNDGKTIVNYSYSWDTSGLDDGVYTLYAKINRTGTLQIEDNPDDWDLIELLVYNNMQSGLSVTVKQADGSPAAGALISVWEVRQGSSDEQYVCVLDEPAKTDESGNLCITGLNAADGLEYLVTARGTNPGFYYMKRVTSPANLLFDVSTAAEISVTGVQADTVLTYADFLVKPVLPGEVLQDENARNCLSELGNISLGKLDGTGSGTYYASPGSYHTSVIDSEQLYFLTRDIIVPHIDTGTPPGDKRIELDYAAEILGVVEIALQAGTNDTPDYFGILLDIEDTDDIESLIGFDLFETDRVFNVTPGIYTMAASEFYSNPGPSSPYRFSLITYNLGRQNIDAGRTIIIGGENLAGDRFIMDGLYINDKEINQLLTPSIYSEKDAWYRVRFTDPQEHSVIRTGSVEIVTSPDGGIVLSYTNSSGEDGSIFPATGTVTKNYSFDYNPLFLYRHVNNTWQEVDFMGDSITFLDYSMKTGEAILKSDASFLAEPGGYKAQVSLYLDQTYYLIMDGLFDVIDPSLETKNLTILASMDGVNPWGDTDSWNIAEFILYSLEDGIYVPYTLYQNTPLINDDFLPGIYTIKDIPFSTHEPLLLVLYGTNGQETDGYPDYTLLYRHFTLSDLFFNPVNNTWTINIKGTDYQLVKTAVSSADETGAPLNNTGGMPGTDMKYGLTFADASGNPAYFPAVKLPRAIWLPNTADYTVTAARIPNDRELKSYFLCGELAISVTPPGGSMETLDLGGPMLNRISVSLSGKDLESAYRIIGIGLKSASIHRNYAFYPPKALPGGGGIGEMMQSLAFPDLEQEDAFEVWVTPDLYEADILFARHHVTGSWGYRLTGTADARGSDAVINANDNFDMSLDMKDLYIASGSPTEFLPVISDSCGDRLVSVFPAAEDQDAWPFGTLDYNTIVPAISVKDHQGQEVLQIHRGDTTLSGSQGQLFAIEGGIDSNYSYLKEYSKDTTYFAGAAENLPEGAYSASIAFGAGPEGIITGENIVFLVRDPASPPTTALFGPEEPVNALSCTVKGISAPGAVVTLSYIIEENPDVSGTLDPITADERGAFELSVPLPEEGIYTVTVEVSHNSQSGTGLSPIYIHADRTPPSPPSGFQAAGQDETSILLSWEASEDEGSGLAGYALYRDDIKIASPDAADLSFLDTNLSPGTNYDYTLTAIDLAENESQATQTTGNPSVEGDTTPPSAPTGLAAENIHGGVILRWAAAADNIGVAGYIINRGPDENSLVEIDRIAGNLLQYTDRSVGFNKTYYFRIDAYDSAGNQSSLSAQEIVPITTETQAISEIGLEITKNAFGYVTNGEIHLGVYASAGAAISRATLSYEKWSGADETEGMQEDTMEIDLEEAPEGFYSATATLPEGTIRVNQITVRVGDESYQAEEEALSSALVFAGSLTVHVSCPDGNDISGFRLELASASTLERKGLITTDGSGSYPFESLSPGIDYSLRLLDDKGNVIMQQSGIKIFSGLTKQTEISLTALSSLRVRLVDSEGNPLNQVHITLLNSNGSVLTMGSSFSDGWVRKQLSNGNTSAAMDLLYYVPAGQQYTLRFSGFSITQYNLRYIPFADRTFNLAPGLNTVEIVLESRQRADVGGKVVDFDSELPVSGIIVNAYSTSGGGYTTMTDDNGDFLFDENTPLPANAAVTLTARSADDTYRMVSLRIEPEDLTNQHEIRIMKEAYADIILDIQVKTFKNGQYHAFNDERNRLEYVYAGNSRLNVSFAGLRFLQKGLMTYRIYGNFTPGQEIPVSVDGAGYNLSFKAAAAVIGDDGKSGFASILLEEKPRINVFFTDENGNDKAGLYRMLALFDMSNPAAPVFINSKQFDSADTFIHTPGPGVYSLIAAWGVADGRDQQKYTYWEGLSDTQYLLYQNLSPEGLLEIDAALASSVTLFPRLEMNYMFLDGVYNFPNGSMGINYQVFFKPSDPLGKAEKFIYHVTLPPGLTVQAKPSSALRINQLPDGSLDVVSGSVEDYAAGKSAQNTFNLFIEVPAGHDKTDLHAQMWAEYSIGATTCTEKIRQVEMEYISHTIKAPDVVFAGDLIFLEDMDISDANDNNGKITVSGSATGPEVSADVYVYDGIFEAAHIPIQGGTNVLWETKINLRKSAVPGKTYLRAKVVYHMPDSTTKMYQTQNIAVNILKASESSGEYVKFNLHGFDSGVTFSHTFLPDGYGQSFKMEGLNIFQGDIMHCSFEVKLNKPHLYEDVEIAAVSGNNYDIIPLEYYPDEGIFYGFGTFGEDGTMIKEIRLMYNLKPFSAAFPFTMELSDDIPDNDEFFWRLPPEIRDAEITVGLPGDNSDPAPDAVGPVDFEQLAGEDGEYVLPKVTITLPTGDQFIVNQKYFPAEGSSLLLDSAQKLDLGGGRYAYLAFDEIPGEKFTAAIRAPLEFLLPAEVPEGFSAAGYSLNSEVFGVTEMLFKLNDVNDVRETAWDIWENIDDYKESMNGIDQLDEELSKGSCGGMSDGLIDSTLKGMRKSASHFAYGKSLMNAIGYAAPGAYNSLAAEMGGDIIGAYEGLFAKQAKDMLDALGEMRDAECDNGEDYDDDDDKDNKKKKKKHDYDKNVFEPMILVDPSGYVFEAVPENRLERVSATIYYLDGGGSWQPYDSEAYDQGPNPNITDSEGKYGWDVFSGQWQVVYEKEGYQTEKSMILPVPPPHLDVDISMVSLDAPEVTNVFAGSGGAYIQMEFSRYMLTGTVTAAAVTVCSGEAVIPGTVTAVDVKTTSAGNKQFVPEDGSAGIVVGDGISVARVFQFIPEDGGALTVGSEYAVTISGNVSAYNNRALSANPEAAGIDADGNWQGTVTVPETAIIFLQSIQFDSDPVFRILKGQSIDVSALLEVYPEDANAFTITWSSNRPDIASVNGQGTVTGLTKGAASIFVHTDTGLVNGISIEVYEEPRTVPLSADHTKNTIRFCREYLVLGQGCYLLATGDRQGEAGLVAGDERYIPLSWHLNDAAEFSGSWSQPPYSTAYTSLQEGTLTAWVVFKKQVFDGNGWIDVDGSEKTASYTITVYGEGEGPGGDPGGDDDPGTGGGTGETPGSGGITYPGTGSGADTGGLLVLNPDGSPSDLVITVLAEQDAVLLGLQNYTALFAQRMNASLLPASQWFELPDTQGPAEVLQIHIPLDTALREANGVSKNSPKLGVYHYDPAKKQWEYVFGKYDVENGTFVFSTDKRGIFSLLEVHKTFPDIESSWAKEYIEILAARQIVDGTGKGYFEPQKRLTRAEFLKMLMEALDIDIEPNTETSFSDVDQNDWHYLYAAAAQKLGIAMGVPGGWFNPDEYVTRRDMALMAVRALKAAGIELEDKGIHKTFIDEKNIPEYAIEAVKALVAAGILSGDEKGNFLPGNSAIRAEAAKIIYLLR